MSMSMTLAQIKADVQAIEDMAGDDEMAHGAEDQLHYSFISHIAEFGPPDLAEMAKMILKTSEIKFSRWCA